MKRFVYSVMFCLAVIFAAGVFSGCENVSNGGRRSGGSGTPGNGNPGNGPVEDPSLPQTAIVHLGTGSDIAQTTSGVVTNETWNLSVVEEPMAVFAVNKTAAQSITVEGVNAGKVTVENAGTFGAGSVKKIDPVTGADTNNPTVYNGYTAEDDLAVVCVDMEDLLFDGEFGGGSHTGTERRQFTLRVREDEKRSRTITVNLSMTLDPATETSIYHRTGTEGAYHYEKVRDAALTTADNKNYFDTSYNFEAYDKGPVKDLQNAFVWVDRHGEQGAAYGGKPAGYDKGTTEGYSEYRLFLKQNQQIGNITLAYGGSAYTENIDDRDCISIELYGAGSPGAEKTITRDRDFVDPITDVFNFIMCNPAASGFISLANNEKPKYQALILGKNITLAGDGAAFPFSASDDESPWYTLEILDLITIHENATLIMRDHSKVTGYYYVASMSYDMVPILLLWESSRFYMRGGEITGNELDPRSGVVAVKTYGTLSAVGRVHFDPGVRISGNTAGTNRVISQQSQTAGGPYDSVISFEPEEE
jgi:hypothetical protein